MEAITAVKIPEWAGSGLTEEAGTDSPSALFARILAGQAEKSRPEGKPAAPVKDGGERDVSRSDPGGSPSTDALEGPFSTDQLSPPAVPALIPLPVNGGAAAMIALPSPDFNRELNFSRTVEITSAPGPQGAPGRSPLIQPALVSESALQATGGGRSSTAATAVPVQTLKNSSREIPSPAGDPKNPLPSRPALAEGGPGKGRSAPVSSFLPGEGSLASLTNLSRLEIKAAEAAETMGRPPVSPVRPPQETPSVPPEAGLLESEKSIPSGPTGALPAEADPFRELGRELPGGKPILRAAPAQSFPFAADPDPLSSPLQPEAAPVQPPAPSAENVHKTIDPPAISEDEAITGPATRSEFFKGEIKSGSGVKSRENPAAGSGKRAADFSATAEAAPAGPDAKENEDVPANPGERLSPVRPAANRPGTIEAEEGFPSGEERIAAAPVAGSPSPKGSLPLEPALAAGGPPEALPVDPEPVIGGTQAKNAVADSAEEKNPLYRQLSRGLVLSLQRGEEKIQLALDPPQLGTIFLELHRKGQLVEARVWTDNEATQGLLDTQQGQLHKALEQEGFRLNRFEVAVQPDLKSFQEERWAQGRQPAWPEPQGQNNENPTETARPPEAEKNLSRFQKGNRFIDTWI